MTVAFERSAKLLLCEVVVGTGLKKEKNRVAMTVAFERSAKLLLSALPFRIASLLVHFELQYNMNDDPQQE
ncbi:hypothetical protein PHYBLDRAFT_152674 [Phycomyces blakesleeanus NRRL 1555(-)]|uniref:Uncharacterized protein n=1 Tax=Phycomyces blakesleeanus (strain ATCC 8743b / DSM 1359 / FGSC 10004 / NBRC 33097 / NRRL 1555) TaxID=763407 RepID=A0A167JJH6_PHYB8|nr:hypothetical protein PHYBLDRAFT_152673 [Phycomyces blakesleeanus NRRL 1555(-)]XP_018284149.1 hypothetical protein PHYBLDRAFT_152674 [Phycomyces blakesleeanus NRRL 1555(-)]OAD66108.1 hypothetical protein PHYBLDRAFT_152673 [Phycomyces blakesleeanus NRRL 1555(-)]OAD66109.1 hypothetical protein PHYBLDRAFT_152674 [Phycomyces blakesleeanus NRRL 1555(-)]|eukprot:XP_018284148.1 hypothetical protein PHYBLDRAFT_152673 [Phycomyces blakesleeanus NRRL 1555(-)]